MIDILEKAARAGGEVLLSYFQKELQIKQKTSQHNIVTQADIEAQKVIHDTLLEGMLAKGIKRDKIGFIEEEEVKNTVATYTFVIDPLDGTSNFSVGFEHFAVSIALFKNGRPLSACIYQPLQNELFLGEVGRGAYLKIDTKKYKLHIEKQLLQNTFLAIDLSSSFDRRNQLVTVLNENLFRLFRQMRIMGAVVGDMAYLLHNKLGAVIRSGPYLWDIAAGKILIEEAGGCVVDWKGDELQYDLQDHDARYNFIACHPDNLQSILAAIKG